MKKTLKLLLALLIIPLSAFAQSTDVSGIVKDAGGEPIIGAVVYYEGTSVMAVTDSKGYYSITGELGKDLTFSCFGFKNEIVTFLGQKTIDVVLKLDAVQLEDAVVIGYGTQQRQDLTGSISSVKADEIRKSGQNNIVGSLQGKVAGLNITSQSGEPGSGFTMNIRGANSINAASTPLVVIDGMQMDISGSEDASSSLSLSGSDPLAFINPSDILSVEVLKDASATAIYGSQGANGVILITTKSGTGSSDKTNITFDASVGVTTMANTIEMLDASEWLQYRFERGDYNGTDYYGYDSDGDGINDTAKTPQMYGKSPIDWRDEMLRTAVTQNYNLSLRTKVAKKTDLLIALGYLNQQGMILNNGYQKLTARVKADHNVNKKIKIGVNVNYARMQSDGAASSTGGSFHTHGLTQMIFLERPIDVVGPDDGDDYTSTSTSLKDIVTDETFRKGVLQKVVGNAYLNYNIIKGLTLRLYASGNFSQASNLEFFTSKSRWGRAKGGVGSRNDVGTSGYTANATLTYKNNFKKAHAFEAMIGAELGGNMYDTFSIQGTNFPDESLGAYSIAKADQISAPVQVYNTNTRMSVFGRVNYNYKSRYYATMNLRADGSSKFSSGSRVGYFPSLSLAWRISNERFMRLASKNWLDNLKLRLSAGVSGNDRIPNYANLSTLDKVYYSQDGKQVLGIAPLSSGNPGLKWETTYQYDLGLDLTLFKSRVDFVFDVYYKDTRDMLFKATLPSQTGFSNQWQNIGRVENKGLEAALSTVNVKRGDFMWSTTLTFDMNRNRILDLGPGIEMMPNNVSKGIFKEEPTRLMLNQPIGIIWGYECAGNYQLEDFDITYTGTDIPVDPSLVTSANFNDFSYKLKEGVTSVNGVTVKPGDRKFKDLSGDNVIKEGEDKKVIGNSLPDFTYGLGNTFSWRGLDFYIFFQGVQGRDILNEFKARSTSGEGFSTYMYNVTKESFYKAWRPENGSNTYSRLRNSLNVQQPVSSFYVEDGSYLKLKTLSVAYNLPSAVCKAIRFTGLKLSFTVDNVWCWTGYSGLDPDISSSNATFQGVDRMGYPTGRTFTFGLVANF